MVRHRLFHLALRVKAQIRRLLGVLEVIPVAGCFGQLGKEQVTGDDRAAPFVFEGLGILLQILLCDFLDVRSPRRIWLMSESTGRYESRPRSLPYTFESCVATWIGVRCWR
jgi:hypothetical protein